jgi:hypothetical protein
VTTRAGHWVAATASVRGGSHERDGRPNQDAVRVVQGGGSAPGLVAAVCDGHGGERYVRSDVGSRLGAEVACDVGRRALEHLGSAPAPEAVRAHLSGPVAQAILDKWRERVLDDLARRSFTDAERARAGAPLDAEPLIAYGCTLLLAVVAQSWIGLLQIGDGDVTAVRDNQADAPVPSDDRLVGGETTSLCLPTAVADARISVLTEPLPTALILTSDGYANSFASSTWRTDAGVDLRDHAIRLGLDEVETRLPGWLADSAAAGGDDVSMALIARVEAAALAPPLADARISAVPPAPSRVSRRSARSRGPVLGVVMAALLVGGAAGWVIAGGDDGDGGPVASASSAVPTLGTATATSPEIIAPSSTADLTITTKPSPATTTTTTHPKPPPTTVAPTTAPATTTPPVALGPQEQLVALAGSTETIVLAFDPSNLTDPRPRVVPMVQVVNEPVIPPGWDYTDNALRFADQCYGALAVAVLQPGYRVWAVETDGQHLAVYDPLTGLPMGRFSIEGAERTDDAIDNPCTPIAPVATAATGADPSDRGNGPTDPTATITTGDANSDHEQGNT